MYFHKPITIILSEDQPRMQQRCPLKNSDRIVLVEHLQTERQELPNTEFKRLISFFEKLKQA